MLLLWTTLVLATLPAPGTPVRDWVMDKHAPPVAGLGPRAAVRCVELRPAPPAPLVTFLEQRVRDTQATNEERGRAAKALGWLQHAPSVPVLAAASRDAPVAVRLEAIEALSHFGAPPGLVVYRLEAGGWVQVRFDLRPSDTALPALVAATKDPLGEVRGWALESLASFTGPLRDAAFEAAVLEGRDGETVLRVLTAAQLKRLRPHLDTYATSSNAKERAALVSAVERAGDLSWASVLVRLLEDPAPDIALAAYQALYTLDGGVGVLPPEAGDDLLLAARVWRNRLAARR